MKHVICRILQRYKKLSGCFTSSNKQYLHRYKCSRCGKLLGVPFPINTNILAKLIFKLDKQNEKQENHYDDIINSSMVDILERLLFRVFTK